MKHTRGYKWRRAKRADPLVSCFALVSSILQFYPRVHRSNENTRNIWVTVTKLEIKMAGYWPKSFFAILWTETKSRPIQMQKNDNLFYEIKHLKMISLLVYLQGGKRKPVACKNKWRLHPETQSFYWFTFLTSKCLLNELTNVRKR